MGGKKQAKLRRPIPKVVNLNSHTKPMHDWAVNEAEIRPTLRDLEPDMAVWAVYHRWCLRYNIVRTPKEMGESFNIFKKNVREVFEMNRMDPSFLFHLSSSCDDKDLFEWYCYEETAPIPTERNMKSDEAVLDLYYRWCLHHQVLRTPEEMELRFTTFKNTVTHVFEMSQKGPTIQFCLSFGCDETDQPVPEVAVIPSKRGLKSGNALLGLYRRYCIHHGIHTTPEVMKQGFNTFKKCVKYVFEKNKKDPSCQFCLAGVCHGRREYMPQEPDGKVSFRIRPNRWDMESDEKVWTLEEMRERFNVFKKHAQEVFNQNLECLDKYPGTDAGIKFRVG